MLTTLLDSLLFTAIGSTVVIAVALAIARVRRLPAAFRHRALVLALCLAPLSLVCLAVGRPGPIGCLTAPCSTAEAAVQSGRVAQHLRLEAAAKLRAEAPPAGLALPADGRLPVRLVIGWACGVVVVGVRMLARQLAVRRLLGAARPLRDGAVRRQAEEVARRLGLGRPPRLLRHPDVASPVVGGVFRPGVFLPPDFAERDEREREMVLLHELGHVRRRDTTASLLGALSCAVFWFHPLAWRALRRMGALQEMATDSGVLQRGVQPSVYAAFLLSAWADMAERPSVPPLTHAIAGHCLLSDRIRALVDAGARHGRTPRALDLALVAGFVATATALTWSPAALQAAGFLTQERRPSGPVELERRLLEASALDSIVRPLAINRMTDRYVAGAAVSVVHECRVVYTAGFGDREVFSEDPVDPASTIFRIGSISKVLTAVAVLQLLDRGLLSLDADVNDYLTEVRIPGTYGEPVRVRHLLTHTGGFDQIGLERHAGSAGDVQPLHEWLRGRLVRIRPPGELSTYDTYGITLAGHLVEAVTGLGYEEYLRRHVLEPLEMHRSGIRVPPALEADVAVGYGFAGEWEALPWEFMHTAPASTVNSTAREMANLALMLLEEGRFGGRRVLSEESARAMLTRQHTNHPDQPGYGYAFFEDRWNGITTFSHGGSMSGYSAMLHLVPEHELGIFIAYNQESAALIDAVLPALMAAFFPAARPPELRKPYDGPLDLSRFTGTYANSVYHHGDPATGWKRRDFELTPIEGGGGVMFDGRPARPVGPLSFQRDDGLLLTFREDDRGEITHLLVKQAVYEKLPLP